jgi:hypothetical protein
VPFHAAPPEDGTIAGVVPRDRRAGRRRKRILRDLDTFAPPTNRSSPT